LLVALGVVGGSLSIAAGAEAHDLDQPLLDYRGPAPVGHDPSPRRLRQFDDAPFHLELQFGAATTVGVLGIVAEYNVLDELALGAGLGLNGFGPIWGVHARARPLIGASRSGKTLHALFVEAAFSRGQFGGDPLQGLGSLGTCDSSCNSVVVVPELISWAQLELGWEAQFVSRLTLRTALGVALALNRPDWRCESGGPVSCAGEALPATTLFVQTLALGYAF
jgi:hypothetical protein